MFNSVKTWIQGVVSGPASAEIEVPVAVEVGPCISTAMRCVPLGELDALLLPGPNANKPVADAEPQILPTPEPNPGKPQASITQEPINWDDERREDLPVRTPARIQLLLEFESAGQTAARILNDKARFRRSRG